MNKELDLNRPFILDFGTLGSETERLVERINIPYTYLPSFLRQDMPGVVKDYIQPLLHDLIRAGKKPALMGEEIAREKERFSPEKLSIRTFLSLSKRIRQERLNLHYRISLLMNAYHEGRLDNRSLVEEGLVLMRKSFEIEPSAIALAALAKTYVEKYMTMMPKEGLSDEELDLLLTMAIPSAYVSFELDMREYLASDQEKRRKLKPRLIKRYFNDEELYFARRVAEMEEALEPLLNDPKKRQQILDDISDIRGMFKSRWVRKVNLLTERKIPYAAEIDEVMMIDNCFDHYLACKTPFLHDIFLKMAMMDIASGRKVLNLTPENLGEKIRGVLFVDNDEFERKMEEYLGESQKG
jgi:hypothetical protein